MENNYDQLKIEYIETKKNSFFVKSISVFLVLIFVVVPLTEIVQHLDYNTIVSYPSYSCLYSFDSIDILSFKQGN